MYSVLRAQAKTRWSITGQGAKSLQTQEVFRKVVKDTIVQDDVTVTISNMRTAISNTHVILNFAIMPGLVLIPSARHFLIPWSGGAFAPLGPFLCPTTEEKKWPIAPKPGP